jgi:hypothetical protein
VIGGAIIDGDGQPFRQHVWIVSCCVLAIAHPMSPPTASLIARDTHYSVVHPLPRLLAFHSVF